jgi:hypothetical protein
MLICLPILPKWAYHWRYDRIDPETPRIWLACLKRSLQVMPAWISSLT